MEKREKWGSRLGFILATSGAAVGLGNIWRFPMLVGENGGGAFVLVYLICFLIIGLPIMMAEMVIGRLSQKNVVDTFSEHKNWKFVGVLSLMGAFAINAYYIVLSGWILGYIVRLLTGQFSLQVAGSDVERLSYFSNYFTRFVANDFFILLMTILFLILTWFIVEKGIEAGLEKVGKVAMPVLFILLIILTIRSITLPGVKEGLSFYLTPDFSSIDGRLILLAIGQVFFSLSIGYGVSITFASYLPKNENIPAAAFYAGITDTLVALLAGFIIFPAVFTFGVSPETGSNLVFLSLPLVFGQMPFGTFFLLLFFILLLIAALTSAIANYEILVTTSKEKCHISRKKATTIIVIFIFIFGNLPSALAYGTLSNISIWGKNIFDFFDFFSGSVLFPLSAFFYALYLGFVVKKTRAIEEISSGGYLKSRLFSVWFFLVKYVIPVVMIVIFLSSVGVI